MVVTDIILDRKYCFIFSILSSKDTEGIVTWIKRKVLDKTIQMTGDPETNLKAIQDACEKKFSERPKVVIADNIPTINISGKGKSGCSTQSLTTQNIMQQKKALNA